MLGSGLPIEIDKLVRSLWKETVHKVISFFAFSVVAPVAADENALKKY